MLRVRNTSQVFIKVLIFSLCCFCFSNVIHAQKSLSKLLKSYNKGNVPYIHITETDTTRLDVFFLDARELSEYKVSHIKDAICVGYDDFDISKVLDIIPDKEQDIIVYCSLGIRSEDIAERLIDAGYKNVKNLYGGIFEWKNSNYEIYNKNHKKTDSIHAFSKEWSKWLKKGIKVYE